MSTLLPTTSLASVNIGSHGFVDFGSAGLTSDPSFTANKPHMLLYNESGCGLSLSFKTAGHSDFIPAGGWRLFELVPGEAGYTWTVIYVLPGAPVSALTTIIFQPNESTPDVGTLGNSPIGIGGTVTTSGSDVVASSLKNDGSPPNTPFIEATPSDQVSSAWNFANDASGVLQILSAGSLKKIFNFVRGNATSGKAANTIGDSTDLSITTFQGTLGTGVNVPASQVNGDLTNATIPAGSIDSGALPAGVTSPNYMPFSGGTFTGNVIFSNTSIGRFDATANFDRAQGGSASPLAQFQSSDQSPAARWTLSQNTDGSLTFIDQSIGHTFMNIRTSGGIFNGVSFISNNGAGTISHGFGATPSWVGMTMVVTNSTMTVGVDGIGSTTVHCNVGTAGSFWQGVCL